MILADKLIELRKQNAWSQEELADRIGVSRQSVSKWESGTSIPDLDKILKLGEIFGVSTDYLLKDELEELTPEYSVELKDEGRNITIDTANEYMDIVPEAASGIGRGVALCILGPALLMFIMVFVMGIMGSSFENIGGAIGTGIMLLVIAFGVLRIVSNSMKLSKFEYLDEEPVSLDYGVKGIVEKRKENFEDTFRKYIAVGVGICIAAVVPLVVVGGVLESELGTVFCVGILLTAIAVAVYMFIWAGMIRGSYQKLLQEGDYTIENKKLSKKMNHFPGIYWCSITAIYLAISFSLNNWDRSWIIWPVAAVAFAAIEALLKHLLKKNL